MKIAVVPAQVTTVEDRIIGSLGFSQILLLVVPVFMNAGIFVVAPPFMGGAVYKYVVMGVVAMFFCVLAIRIKGKILAFWLVTILRYNLRPKYYLFNKNVTTLREDYPMKRKQHNLQKEETKEKVRMTRPQLDIPTTARMLATIENPAANVRFETGKKGDLRVRFTEVEE